MRQGSACKVLVTSLPQPHETKTISNTHPTTTFINPTTTINITSYISTNQNPSITLSTVTICADTSFFS